MLKERANKRRCVVEIVKLMGWSTSAMEETEYMFELLLIREFYFG